VAIASLHSVDATREEAMAANCPHLLSIQSVEPTADGCVECMEMGSRWVHLRRCVGCGHVGCCDSSPNRHATAHFGATKHPLVQSFEPGENWYWCYEDKVALERPGEKSSPSHS
jgi:hypothetical protein